jgi:hypothetical protein
MTEDILLEHFEAQIRQMYEAISNHDADQINRLAQSDFASQIIE